MATLEENGDIVVLYATNSDGQASHGESTHSPKQEGYKEIGERHKIGEANGRRHFIAKKMIDDVWADIGDGWLS